jgi:hypothetical protein
MKKIFAIVLTFVFITSIATVSIAQDLTEVRLEVEKATAFQFGYQGQDTILNVGASETFIISVYARNITNMLGFQIRIDYTKAKYSSVTGHVGSVLDPITSAVLEASPLVADGKVINKLDPPPSDTMDGIYLGHTLPTNVDAGQLVTIGDSMNFLGKLTFTTAADFNTTLQRTFDLSEVYFLIPDTATPGEYIEFWPDTANMSSVAINGATPTKPKIPVELTVFNVIALSSGEVELTWETASEINNLRFDILRSVDGMNFDKIGSVAGHGTTNETQSYRYLDNSVNAGDYYYRLKQIDINGDFEEFDVTLHVNIPVPDKYELGYNYPNPFNPTTNIPFSLKEAGVVKITIYNLLGQEVRTLTNSNFTAGRHEVVFNARGLATGIYFYRLQVNGMSFMRKFVLMK